MWKMDAAAAPANRHNLCVVSQHEDEGYLSPSEEDLLRFNSQRFRTNGYLNCNKVKDGGCLIEKDIGEMAVANGVQDSDEDSDTPWDIIATTPQIQHEHLSWDRLKLPVPYRFYTGHKLCLRQIRKSPSVSYVTDCTAKHPKVVESIWRSCHLLKLNTQESEGQDATVSQIDNDKLSRDNFFHVPVHQFVQHVFHLVCGRESISFSRVKECRFSFKKNPYLLVHGLSPGSITNFSRAYLTSARIFKRLTHFSVLHYDNKLMEREGLQRNAVFISFLKYISDYLKLYETSLMLMEPNIHSLGRLSIFFKPFQLQLETLEHVLDLYVAADQITLLKGLNTMMLCCEISCVADVLRGAFIACASAYLRYVSDWIFRGSLTQGFHVQSTKLSTYNDRRYWVKQFSQVASVPTFLENVADTILETGKAINLLNLIRNTEPRSSLLFSILYDEYTIIQPTMEFTSVAALESEWEIKTESFFEEFSFLKTDIESTLASPKGDRHQSPNHVVDFDAIEEAKRRYEKQRMDMRQAAFDRKIEKQKSLHNSLNLQITERKNREMQEKEDAKLEDEKIADYIAKVDKRDLREEIRLMKKHFGERQSETVGVKNVRERIANTGNDTFDSENYHWSSSVIKDSKLSLEEVEKASQSKSESPISNHAMNDPTAAVIVEDLIEFELDPTSHSRRNSKNVTFDQTIAVHQSAIKAEGDKVCHLSCDLNDDSNSNLIKSPNEEVLGSQKTIENSGEVQEKFDPENIKIRDTIPFCTDFDFSESILLPKALSALSSSHISSSSSGNSFKQNTHQHDSFYLNNFLSQSVAIPTRAQNRMVNATLLHYFIVERQLFQNLRALNDYLCLQNGLFGHFLTKLLVNEVNAGNLVAKDDIPKKIGRFNEILGESLSLSADGTEKSEYREKLGFKLSRENVRNSIDFDSQKTIKSRILTSKYEVLDEILLNYSVDWPLSLILTDDLLINYEKLFSFLMRLYRAEVLLLEVGSILKYKGKNSPQFTTLNHHRYLMLHFVRTIRHYINVTVIHCAWTELESSFHRLDSLDKLYEGLVRHIKFVTTNCLLGTKGEGVKKLLTDQLIVIECFCSEVEKFCGDVDWSKGEDIETRRFAKLDQKFKVWEEIQKVFIKVVYKLANKGTYQVSYFLQLFNINGYFGNDIIE